MPSPRAGRCVTVVMERQTLLTDSSLQREVTTLLEILVTARYPVTRMVLVLLLRLLAGHIRILPQPEALAPTATVVPPIVLGRIRTRFKAIKVSIVKALGLC